MSWAKMLTLVAIGIFVLVLISNDFRVQFGRFLEGAWAMAKKPLR